MVVNFYRPVEVFFGKGAVNRVGEIARRYGFKALIVTGKKSARESGALEKVIRSLNSHGIQEYILYNEVIPNPTDQVVNEGARIAVEEKIDFIIGLGGGSALDTAKAISITSSNEGSVWDYMKYPEGPRLVPYLNRPVICIPTTAGTGSEVNKYSVITNSLRKEKLVLSHSLNYPRVALIDPELSITMNAELTAITGFDALIHALESLTNRAENFMAEEHSVKAIELIAKWLPVAIEEPDNYKAREAMSYASMLAGVAIDHLGVALIHAMEHPVSAHYPDVAHGLGLAILAPYVTKFNYKGNPEKYALFAKLMGYEEKPELAVDALVDFLERIGLLRTLKDVGVEEGILERLTEDVYMLARHSFLINPVEPTLDDVRKIYQEAYEGKL
ncbi:alcohol dehydrogenase/1,3-propanediol dehydrogenase [Hydrogenivirga caldilitoris]|uniref:Alcohol dehydrogenase/1,3-propanediol dehydrogenase n=1 Tax=Hydrogenivirga caldilitoris TaxID=246264 RepID=A0A497XV67_9AQUI|nr:iron-containing alcohol dehydrogenase [Hydrogenivirga caldilitoris]RLJ71052.1 alcohol dehydrogenase/1,3-propanediol dehydrogenase [Hydrogenivirga caldilitoris]